MPALRFRRWSIVAALPLLLALTSAYGQEKKPPPEKKPEPWLASAKQVYRCVQVAPDAIRIDGDPTERAWQLAQRMVNFKTAGAAPAAVRFRTAAMVLWTKAGFIWAFHCETNAIRPSGTERDSAIWDGESVELFLSPWGPEKPYFELNVSPTNVIYDSKLYDWRYVVQIRHWQQWAKDFTGNIRSAIKVHRSADGQVTGWSMEAAIPFTDLLQPEEQPPKAGDVWRFKACRAAAYGDKKIEFSSWQPTFSHFHRPFAYPQLLFVEAPAADAKAPAAPE